MVFQQRGVNAVEKPKGREAIKKAPESRKEVIEDTTRERAEIATDVREELSERTVDRRAERTRQAGEALEPQIESERSGLSEIRLDLGIEEQKEAIDLLESVSASLLAKLVDKLQLTRAQLALGKLPELTGELVLTTRLGSVEVRALEKLKEIGGNLNTRLAKEWAGVWESLLDQFLPDIELGKKLRESKSDEKTDDTLLEKTWSTIKEHPYATAGLVVGGAVGVWQLWNAVKSFTSGEKGTVEKTIDTAKYGLPGMGAVAGALLCLGAMLGSDYRYWIRQNLGFDITLGRIWKFIMSGGDLEVFKEGIVEVDEVSRHAADYLGADREKVAALGKIPYAEFVGASSQIQNQFISWLLDNVPEGVVPAYLFDKEEQQESSAAAKAVTELFRSPGAKATFAQLSEQPKTVGEALAILDRAGMFGERQQAGPGPLPGAPIQPGDPIEKPSEEETTTGDIWDGVSEGAIGISSERWESLKEKIGGNSHIEAWMEGNGGYAWMNPFKMKSFIEAVYADGKGLVNTRGGLLLWDGASYILLSPLRIVGHTFETALEATLFEHKTWGDVARTYVDESGELMVLFGAPGVIKGMWQFFRGNRIEGLQSFGRGIGNGILAPATLGKWEYQKGQDISRYFKETGMEWAIHRAKKSPEMTAEYHRLRMQQLKWYAERFEQYDRYHQAQERGGLSTGEKGVSRGEHLRRRGIAIMDAERVESQRLKFGEKFAKLYNEMLKQNEFGPEFKGVAIEDPKNPLKMQDQLRVFGELFSAEQSTKILERAQEIKSARMKGTGWDRFDNAKVDRMLQERGIKIFTPEAEAYMEAWDRKMAEQEIQGKKFNPHAEIVSETVTSRARVRHIESTASGEVFEFQRQRFTIPSGDVAGFPDKTTQPVEYYSAAREYCAKKWRIPAHEVLTVEAIETLESGGKGFRINGEVIEAVDAESAKARYLDALVEEGKPLPKGFAERIAYHMSWAPAAELVLGTVGTAVLIYELETAEDKEAATKRALALIGTAIGGAKVFEKTLGKVNSNPYFHLFGNISFGVLAAMGFEDEAEAILGGVIETIFPEVNREQTMEYVAHLTELSVARKWLVAPVLSQAPKLASKMGMQQVEKFLLRKIESKVIARIGRAVGGSLAQRILIGLGWKGAATGILLADDATVIGVVDDVVAVGLVAWSIYDIYEIGRMVLNGRALQYELEQRKNKAIEEIEFPNKEDEEALLAKLKELDIPAHQLYKEGKINPEILKQIPESTLFAMLDNSTFIIKREGSGKEYWSFKDGEMVSVIMYDQAGAVIASMTDEDLESIEKSIEEYETALTQVEGEVTIEPVGTAG